MPIGVPGWPDFAFWIASIASVRIVLMQSESSRWRSCAFPLLLIGEPFVQATSKDAYRRSDGYRGPQARDV